jgi:hypothetical protein
MWHVHDARTPLLQGTTEYSIPITPLSEPQVKTPEVVIELGAAVVGG